MTNGSCVKLLDAHSSSIPSLTFSPDGKYLSSCSYGEIKLWNLNRGICEFTLKNGLEKTYISCLSYSPDGKNIAASCGWQKTLKIWSVERGECLRILTDHSDCVNAVLYSTDGNFLFSGSLDLQLKIWDPVTGKCLNSLSAHSRSILAIAVSHDGKYIFTGSADETVKLWVYE